MKETIVSKLFTSGILGVLLKGFRRKLSIKDLYRVEQKDSTRYLVPEFSKQWGKEMVNSTDKPSLLKTLFRIVGKRFIGYTLFCIFVDSIRTLQCLILALLLDTYEDNLDEFTSWRWILIFFLIMSNFVCATGRYKFSSDCQKLGMKIRIILTSTIYTKVLKLSQKSLADYGTGNLSNLLSNDLNIFDRSLLYVPSIVSSPIQVLIGVWIFYGYLGTSCFAGIAIICLFIPCQSYVSKRLGKLRTLIAKATDTRLCLMTNILNSITAIKIYTWEPQFSQLMSKARKSEMGQVFKKSILYSVNYGVFDTANKLVVLVTIIVYLASSSSKTFNASQIYLMLSLFNTLRSNLSVWFPLGVTAIWEMMISLNRITKLLVLEERVVENVRISSRTPYILLRNVSASWPNQEENNSVQIKNVINNVNLEIQSPSLYVIKGEVGSGKSSLLQVIMEELPPSKGIVYLEGNVAYATQGSWLFPGTIQENILCGKEFNSVWYQVVVAACALTSDINILPNGDQTQVGDKGNNLSGGQKARINLARTLYQKADIYLLDDPLCAVDTKVSEHLMNECINKLLKNKIILFVTNNFNFDGRKGELKYTNLNIKNGEILYDVTVKKTEESYSAGITIDELYESLCKESTVSTEVSIANSSISIKGTYGTFNDNNPDEALESECLFHNKRVTWGLYWKHWTCGNNLCQLLLFIVLNIFAQFLTNGSDYWLKIWLSTTITTETRRLPQFLLSLSSNSFVGIYAALCIACILFSFLRALHLFKILVSSSIELYKLAFDSVINAPISYFQSHPIGNTLNIFSNDFGTMDEGLQIAAFFTITTFLAVIGSVVTIVIVEPLLIIPSILTLVISEFLRKFYQSSSTLLKRMETQKRGPIIDIMNSTVNGLATIRALKSELYFKTKFFKAQDEHTGIFFTYLSAFRWFQIATAILGSLFFTSVVLIIVTRSSDPSAIGLVIISVMALNLSFTWAIFQASEFSDYMISVERIFSLLTIKPEDPKSPFVTSPPTQWPSKGGINIQNLVVKYGNNQPALKGISLKIESGTRIGIVGRTGAGKSSLLSALFRLVEPEKGSHIYIDGIDIMNIGLQNLRSRLSYIPQDPILFQGTLRENLDLLGTQSDSALYNAIDIVQLKRRIESTKLGLEMMVDNAGANFSQGERQLISLARVILTQNTILVMDEATSNIDPSTEQLIQNILKEKYKNATIIIVAHKLQTVMDADKICVLNQGEIVEFGEPYELLMQNSGWLFDLVNRTGNKLSSHLRYTAEKAHFQRLAQSSINSGKINENSF